MTDTPETPSDTETVRTARGRGPAPVRAEGADGFNPYAKLFGPDGTLNSPYVEKRIPTLVSLLRQHPGCFPIRLDHDKVGERLLHDDAADLREAKEEDRFEATLAAFSKTHLHKMVTRELAAEAVEAFRVMTLQTELSRRQRVAAAIGLSLLSGLPDETGLVGRSVFDLVFRVTLEELHAQERIRTLAAETEGGLGREELDKFWTTYPALRHRHEERYRREVTHVVEAVEARNFPMAISLDLALRGAAALMAEVSDMSESGGTLQAARANEVLREPFESDLLDGGLELVLHRWHAATEIVRGASDDRRAYARTAETAIRIVGNGGPGADVILFAAYLHAIAGGRFHVDDPGEAEAARAIFVEEGLSWEGTLVYAKFHTDHDNRDAARRVLLAALEVWPQVPEIVAAVSAMGEREETQARETPQGPVYDVEDDGGDEQDAGAAAD